ASALEPVCPGLHSDITQIVRAMPNPTRKARELVDAFVSRIAPGAVKSAIIDDYHLLAIDPASAAFLEDLCVRLDVRQLVAARQRPGWATARSRMYGEVLELAAVDLALTADETADVLRDATPALRNLLTSEAEGWPALIGLATLPNAPRAAPRGKIHSTLFRF